MHYLNRIYLFIKHYMKQFKRKWVLLPLILFLPILLVGTVIVLTVLFIVPDENDPIKVGIVDYDGSEETKAVIGLLEQSTQLGPLIMIESMSEAEAKERIIDDELSAYVAFPNEFTNDLYTGKSVLLHVIGNENRLIESHLIKELIDSIMRHIRTSQATILMINEQARQLGMGDEERRELIFEQFTTSFLNVLGKDQVISEKKITHHATMSPIDYYSLSIVFVLIFIWLIIIYNVLYTKERTQLAERMKLYGVTESMQIVARIIVTICMTTVFVILVTYFGQHVLQFNLYREDVLRISLLLLLNSIIYLQLLALCEMVVPLQRLRLFIQSLLTLLLIFFSGAIIPTIYLPLIIQQLLPYVPSYHSLFWLQEIVLNERFFAEFNLLIIYMIVCFVLLYIVSFVKERVT